jgi:uncharacterized protein
MQKRRTSTLSSFYLSRSIPESKNVISLLYYCRLTMTHRLYVLIVSFMICINAGAISSSDSSFKETSIVLHTGTGDIFGTLALPTTSRKVPVVLIIAGSGPTDRNGNNAMMKNESLRMLAYALAGSDIASVRFDKRGIGESSKAFKTEADLRFDDYINDVKAWIFLLRTDKHFSNVVVVGHSEGSLIGMIAANGLADGFISIAGAGKSADKLIKEQLQNQPENVKELCFPILDSLVAGKTVKDIDPMLYSLFRPSVQPYMISWFQYDPQIEIQKLKIPVLVAQGTNDIQVSVQDAQQLMKANPKAILLLIANMNHIFKMVKGDRKENLATYNDPLIPVSNELVSGIVDFIKKKIV